MRLLKKFTVVGLAIAALALMPTRADAALLTINDGVNTWSYSTQTNCTTCSSVLSVVIPGGSNYIGNFLADFQWTIDGETPTASTLTATNAGATSDWAITFDNLNSNGCSGGDPHAVCGDWKPAGAATGFGPLSATTLTWSFTTTFSGNIGTPTTGNIRALIIDANGNIVSLFSPGGGDFGGGGSQGGGGSTIPEPASMLLLGAGALATAYRARRRATR
jgi:hypothetical protein